MPTTGEKKFPVLENYNLTDEQRQKSTHCKGAVMYAVFGKSRPEEEKRRRLVYNKEEWYEDAQMGSVKQRPPPNQP